MERGASTAGGQRRRSGIVFSHGVHEERGTFRISLLDVGAQTDEAYHQRPAISWENLDKAMNV